MEASSLKRAGTPFPFLATSDHPPIGRAGGILVDPRLVVRIPEAEISITSERGRSDHLRRRFHPLSIPPTMAAWTTEIAAVILVVRSDRKKYVLHALAEKRRTVPFACRVLSCPLPSQLYSRGRGYWSPAEEIGGVKPSMFARHVG